MKKIKKRIFFLAVYIFVNVFLSFGKTENLIILKVYTFNRPPLYIVSNNNFSGTLVEKAKKIFEKAGISYKFIEMPPARILHYLSKEKNACSIGWFKTEERENRFIYSKPIHIESQCFIMATRKNLNVEPEKILNSPLFSIALVKGFYYGDEINNILKNSKIRKFYVPKPDAEKLLLMVKNRRVDLAIISKEEAQFLLKKKGFQNSIKLYPFKENIKVKRYIIFSKQTDREIIEKINRAIGEVN